MFSDNRKVKNYLDSKRIKVNQILPKLQKTFCSDKVLSPGGMVNLKVESHITFDIGPCPTLFNPVFR